MSYAKIKVRIYSDFRDVSSITSAIKKVDRNVQVILSDPKDIIDPKDISIIQIDTLESSLLSGIIDLKSSFLNNVIFIVPDGRTLLVSTLVKLGFVDIFVFPYESVKFASFLTDVLEKCRMKQDGELFEASGLKADFFSINSSSDNFLKIQDTVKKVSKNKSLNILILGETGTGKGLLARTIHQISNEKDAPFVDVLCTSIPENLLESELFGHEKGSFTHAERRKLGLFEMAENGTLFLDEIGDLSYALQSKLLRAIEKKVIRRIGGLYDIPIKTRIISATNRDLVQLIEQKKFRKDLFYRLNSVTIDLPPLRKRDNDVLLLTKYFMHMFNKQFDKKIKRIDKEVLDYLYVHNWPGNVRELRNSIERAVLLGKETSLKLKYFSDNFRGVPTDESDIEDSNSPNYLKFKIRNYKNTNLMRIDKLYAKAVLEKVNGNKRTAAKILSVSRPKLDSLLK